MSPQEIMDGQRTGKEILDSAWDQTELDLLKTNGVSQTEIVDHFELTHGADTLAAAIGCVKALQGKVADVLLPQAQETQAEANADVAAKVQEENLGAPNEEEQAKIEANAAQAAADKLAQDQAKGAAESAEAEKELASANDTTVAGTASTSSDLTNGTETKE